MAPYILVLVLITVRGHSMSTIEYPSLTACTAAVGELTAHYEAKGLNFVDAYCVKR